MYKSLPCATGDDGCQTDIEDTAEAQKTWISSMEAHGYCSCDREHMFDCPDVQLAAPGGEGIKSSSRGQAFSDVVDGIFNDKVSFSQGGRALKFVFLLFF